MPSHWSRKLDGGIGRLIESAVLDIEKLQEERELLKKKLEQIDRNLNIQEFELLQSIQQEWSREDISRARENR